MLQGLVSRYEAHHKVSYTREAIEAAVTLSERHIPDRRLPDKALDLLDEAGSRARITTDLARNGEADIHAHHRHMELSQVCILQFCLQPKGPDHASLARCLQTQQVPKFWVNFSVSCPATLCSIIE